MLANELRIGNYVECSDVIHYIDELRNNGAHTFCLYPYDSRKYNVFEGHVYYKNLNPIPLTEQWLKDFGFEKNPDIEYITECFGTDVYYYLYGEMLPYDRIMKFDEKWCLSNSDGDYNTNCQYVHQLQNLYFALTGKELTKC